MRSVRSRNAARRRARTAALGGALALALSAQPAGAAPTPIPEGAPIGSPPPTFIGTPAVQNPVFASRPPRHPFMAPNDRSELHNDAYQTDANVGPGPLGIGMQRLSTLQFADCGSITFDSNGRLVTICVGLVRPTLMMIDPNTLDTLASMPLPQRDPSGGKIFNDFAAGGYFYLDNRDRAVLLTNSKHLLVVRETPGPGFAVDRDYDLTSAIKPGDKGFSALPDWSGRLWFVTSKAVVGTIDPAAGKVRSMQLPDGDVENSFAVDETGGVYVVTNRALYRFDPGPSGEPKVTWREVYPNSGIQKPGQGDIGTGTTPTLMDHGLVAITDNADPMDIVVYKRARNVTGSRVVCKQPVFQKGASATDNSLIAAGRAMVVENNYGYSGPQATENGKTTSPGVWRVDVNPSLNGCSTIWKSNEISPTVVPKLSLANGLVYLYTKNPSSDGSDDWYLTAAGFRTGRTLFKRLAGEGLGFNNNYAPITIGPDNGSVYVGTLGGMVMLRDAVPPPRPTSSSGKPRLTLSLSYRRRHHCAIGPEKAKVGGPDAHLLGEVDFSAGGRTWRVFHPPFARRFDLEGGERGHQYTVRALAKLVDGRHLSLRGRLRVCPD